MDPDRSGAFYISNYKNPNFDMNDTDDESGDQHTGYNNCTEDIKSSRKHSKSGGFSKNNDKYRNDGNTGVVDAVGVAGEETEARKRDVGVRVVTSEDATSQSELTPVKTIAFCRFIARRHKLAFGLTLGCHVFIILLSAILILTGYDLFPTEFTNVPLDILDDVMFLRGDAWVYRTANYDTLYMQGEEESMTPVDALFLYYEGDNVFTKENLQTIATFEETLIAIPTYNNVCQLTTTALNCQKPLSIIRFFDGTHGPMFNDSLFENIPQTLANVNSNRTLSEILQFHLGKDATVDPSGDHSESRITRTQMLFGNRGRQDIEDFLANKFLSKLKNAADNGLSGMSFIYYSRLLFQYEIGKQVIVDLLLAGGSFMFIFIFMLIQTQSLFLTSLAIFSILSSFLGANLLYRILFDYIYFGIFHVLSVFIILGIGADDIFVYYDTWRDTAHEKHPNLEERVSACYRRAGKAMLITSLTTMIAFIVNAFSPLLVVGSFGLFSGILVFVNYMSVVIFFPTVVVMYHKYLESWTWPCFRFCVRKSDVSPASKQDGHRKHFIVRFFKNPFFRLVTHAIAKWIIIAACITLIVVLVYFAALLQPEKEAVKQMSMLTDNIPIILNIL